MVRSRLMRSLAAWLVACAIGCVAAQAAAPWPDTSTAFVRAQTFTTGMPRADYFGAFYAQRKVVWANGGSATSNADLNLPSGTLQGMYFAIDRVSTGARPHGAFTWPGYSLSWFQANHPTWIVYQHDQLTPAYQFSDTNEIPLDISNPDVQAWLFANLYTPALAQGFTLIDIDNGDSTNAFDEEGTCSIVPTHGCAADGGTWTQIYTGIGDPVFYTIHAAWLTAIRAQFPSLPMLVNIGSYSHANETGMTAIIGAPGGAYWEEGFNGDAGPPSVCQRGGGATYQMYGTNWTNAVKFFNGLNSGNGYPLVIEQANCPKATPDRRVVDYGVASYCMLKRDATYVAPYFDSTSALEDQSAGANIWPEFYFSTGTQIDAPPTAPDGNGVWHRAFANILCLVNPSATAFVSYTLSGSYHGVDGSPYSGTIVIPPITGLLLIPGASPGSVFYH